MIYLLKNEITGEEVMLPEVKAYSIGRQKLGGNKDDIVLANDQSISRNHAKITIKENGVVTIKDCKSRYHTLHNNKKLEPEQEVELKKGDAIQFGILKNRFRFETYSCIVTVSGLSSLKKLEVKNNVNYCGGRFVEKWCSNCTHLTVDKITLTVKVLQALVDEKPIVTTDYWNAYRENFDNNQPPPDITKYNRPQVAEQLLSSNFQCQPNPMRKTLFKDKVFVFFKNSLKNQMEDIIQSCGGTCISYQDESTAPTEICASPDKFIVMKHEEESESYKILIQNLVSGGRRAIALNEIALAVINCSCATHCNPKFDKANHVFARATCIMDTQQVLVQETQSEVIVEKVESHPADVIPATLEEEWDHVINPTVTEADTSKTSGVKRAHGDNNAVEVFKKARFKPKPKENLRWKILIHGTGVTNDNPEFPPEIQQVENDAVNSDDTHTRLNDERTSQTIDNSQIVNRNITRNTRKRVLREYEYLLTKLQKVTTEIDKSTEQDLDNEFDIFGKSVAAQLKNMPLIKAIEAQMFVQNYLSELRLRTIQDTTYSPGSSSSASSNYNLEQSSPSCFTIVETTSFPPLYHTEQSTENSSQQYCDNEESQS